MCRECENLLNVAINKKETTVLKDGRAIDTTEDKWIMQLNRHEDGTPHAFMAHHLTIESTQRCYNTSLDIRYCPFCGEKLVN